MAVYIVPRSRYYGGFWGSLGEGAAGLVTNLLGTQLNAMIERGNEQRKVNQRKAFASHLPADYAGMTRAQQEYSLLTNPLYPLLSEDERKEWRTHLDNNEQTRGWEQEWVATKNTRGKDFADATIGARRSGTDASVQRELLDIHAPTYNTTAVDQGDSTTLVFSNPRDPSDRMDISFDKNLSPQDILNADLMQKGWANDLEKARLSGRGIVSGLMGRGGAGAGSSAGPEDWAKYRAEIVGQMRDLDQRSDAYKALSNQLEAIDTFLGNTFGYSWDLLRRPDSAPSISEAQVNDAAKKIMDDARKENIDIPREEALERARRQLGQLGVVQ